MYKLSEEKLYKWVKCAALQEAKYNTWFFKIILLAYRDTYAKFQKKYTTCRLKFVFVSKQMHIFV